MGKGEIACYEQFLLFPQCFQRLVSEEHQKVSLCGNGLRAMFLNRCEFDTVFKTNYSKGPIFLLKDLE